MIQTAEYGKHNTLALSARKSSSLAIFKFFYLNSLLPSPHPLCIKMTFIFENARETKTMQSTFPDFFKIQCIFYV
jgi:hypothetical protein